MWDFLAQEMETPIIDEGVVKLTPEFLVHGHAYPTAENKSAVAVRAELSGVSKTLFAFGDRYWQDRKTATSPKAFDKLPLSWANAYGGPDYPANPQGKGRQVIDGVHWLPNLEHPNSRAERADRELVPAGFGALEVMHPQRAKFNGTYDEAWLKEHSPAVAPDTQWKHFNIAPRDQWLEAPLKGDESFALENMHPTTPRIDGKLPGFRVRVFANHERKNEQGTSQRLREIPLQLTTVWFFPHAERMILVYQGMEQTLEDDAFDIKHLMGAIDRLQDDPRRSQQYFAEVFDKRIAGGPMTGLHLLNDAELLPPDVAFDDPAVEQKQAPLKMEGFKEAAEFRRANADVEVARQRLRDSGQDPDQLGVSFPEVEKAPTPQEMPAYIDKLTKQMEEEQWATVEEMVSRFEELVELKEEGKIDLEKLRRGPPTFRASEELDRMEALARKSGKKFDRKEHEEALGKVELAHRYNYLHNAHLELPAHPLQGEQAIECRNEVEWLLDNGYRTLPAIDLTGADLSNMDLRGVDLSLAWLESANLTNTNLSRAKLQGCVLAHARLDGTIAIGADFTGANLGSTTIRAAHLDRSNLSDVILMNSKLSGSSLRGALLKGCNLLQTQWSNMDLSQATGTQILFHELDLNGTIFAYAQLGSSTFLECSLKACDFSGADLQSCNFLTCRGDRSTFHAANLKGAGFSAMGTYRKADFSNAVLKESNFGDADFSGACLAGANLDGANLTRAKLNGCDGRRAKVRGAMLRKALLSRSRWSGTDFKEAILSGSDLRGADLRDCNFFAADLSRAWLDTATKIDGSVLERARTYPRRRSQPTDTVS